MYGDESENGGEREIKLFEGGDHGLSGLGPEVEGLLLGFIGRVHLVSQRSQQSELNLGF